VQEEADLGLAFDGDGDRLGVVDSSGKVIWTDRVLMLLAADVLSRNPGTDVVFDVKCSRHLADEILRNGGRPVMSRSGHSPLKNKLRETGALLGGEWSGHILFAERWYGFDDALYAGARLLEILALDPRSTTEVFASLPEALSTPELILPLADEEAELIMHTVLAVAERMEGVDVQTVDGLRANMKRGWGLVRASNTRPALTFRFEADDASAMEGLKDLFRDIMSRAAPGLELPF
jgi:phosphomannomutase/phosphoglucomutase